MRVIYKFTWLAALLPLVWACGEMDQPPIIQQSPSTLTNPASGTNIVLSQEDAEEKLVFEVSSADFGTTGEVTYTLQMDISGNQFANPVDFGASTTTTIEVEIGEFNKKLIAEGLEPEVAGAIEVRVKSSINKSLRDIFGSPITLNVTPYLDVVELPFLRVPGDYQGWNPGNDNTIIYSAEADDVYEGFVHILGGSGEFKFITGPAWDEFPDFGSAGNNTLVEKGGNLKISGDPGTYRVKADLNNLTYEMERIGMWGIIGSATSGGWDKETPMSFNAADNILTITTDLTEGDMKFRTQSWDNNYGLGTADGVGGFDGGNIPITSAGNYTITLDFKTPGTVLYSVTKN